MNYLQATVNVIILQIARENENEKIIKLEIKLLKNGGMMGRRYEI